MLEQPLFRHAELMLLLDAREHRFVSRALDEVHSVEGELGATEVIRATVVEALVPEAPEPSIDDATGTAPPALVPALERLTLDSRRLHDGIEDHRRAAYETAGNRGDMVSRAQTGFFARGYSSDGSALLGA